MGNQATTSITPAKRSPGRPATGSKTAAERMREHRKRRSEGQTGKGRDGERVLNTSISTEAFFALHRLARHNGVTQKEFIEKMLIKLDQQVLDSLPDIDSPEWQAYFYGR